MNISYMLKNISAFYEENIMHSKEKRFNNRETNK